MAQLATPRSEQEVELKFTFHEELQARLRSTLNEDSQAATLDELRKLLKFGRYELESVGRQTIVDTYFDTPSRLLYREHGSLRIREAEGRAELTLKLPESQGNGQFVRREHSIDLDATQLQRHKSGINDELGQWELPLPDGGPWSQTLTIRNQRDNVAVSGFGERYMLSVDLFTYEAPRGATPSRPQLEIEIEALDDYSKTRLPDVRDNLVRFVHRFRYSEGSKYCLGINAQLLDEAEVAPIPPASRHCVVFVHGLGGTRKATWGRLPQLIALDALVGPFCDVDFYEYPTSVFRLPFFSKPFLGVRELAAGLRTFIDARHKSQPIVIVCHSLGGLVARQYVVDQLEHGKPLTCRALVLYAVPNEGAELASLSSLVSFRHNQCRQLCKSSDYLEALNASWARLRVVDRLPVRFVVAGADRVVGVKSASGHLGLNGIDVIPDKGHKNIVKPKDANDLAFVLLRDALAAVCHTKEVGGVPRPSVAQAVQ